MKLGTLSYEYSTSLPGGFFEVELTLCPLCLECLSFKITNYFLIIILLLLVFDKLLYYNFVTSNCK